jgi:hypothetical protein
MRQEIQTEHHLNNLIPWLLFASELYQPSDRRLSAELVPTFADRGCRVVSAADPHGRIVGFRASPQCKSKLYRYTKQLDFWMLKHMLCVFINKF